MAKTQARGFRDAPQREVCLASLSEDRARRSKNFLFANPVGARMSGCAAPAQTPAQERTARFSRFRFFGSPSCLYHLRTCFYLVACARLPPHERFTTLRYTSILD
jgi:hypothetical protein